MIAAIAAVAFLEIDFYLAFEIDSHRTNRSNKNNIWHFDNTSHVITIERSMSDEKYQPQELQQKHQLQPVIGDLAAMQLTNGMHELKMLSLAHKSNKLHD